MPIAQSANEKKQEESSSQFQFFSQVLNQIRNRQFSRKTIRREKRKFIQERRRSWASLGAESLNALAAQFSPTRQPARALCAQIACMVHRFITALPGLILSPVAGAIGTLESKFSASDRRAVRRLEQKFLTRTLHKLNLKIEELQPKASKSPAIHAGVESKTRGKFALSAKVREDLKAILAYAKAFDQHQHRELSREIQQFEKFVEMINQKKFGDVPVPKMPLTLIDPYIEEEL